MIKKWPVLCILIFLIIARASGQEISDDLKINLGEIAYQADFGRDWRAGHDRDNQLIWQPTSQGLALTSISAEAPARYVDGTDYQATDFYLELTFIPAACASDKSSILLNVRSDPAESNPITASAYVFVMQCDGNYRARSVNEGGSSGLIDFEGQLTLPLNMKTPVTMGIFLQERQAAWFWDGELLGTFEISQLPREGQFAIGAQLGLDGLISDLTVWELADSSTSTK